MAVTIIAQLSLGRRIHSSVFWESFPSLRCAVYLFECLSKIVIHMYSYENGRLLILEILLANFRIFYFFIEILFINIVLELVFKNE